MDISLLDQGHSCDFRGGKFFCSPLLSFIDWLFMWKTVWRRLWAFHLSLCASQNNLCCFSVHPRPQREPEGPSGCFFFTALPTAVEHQTLTPCFSKVNHSGQLLLERNCSLGSASKPPCQLCPQNVLLHPLQSLLPPKQSKLLRHFLGNDCLNFHSPGALGWLRVLSLTEHSSTTLN